MIFWITNDNGNIHTNSNFSEPIGLEIQNMAYAFLSDDEAINNASFYNQRIINRKSILTNSYVALWSDPDLGCSLDDKIGYDTLRNLMYVYNGDALDGYSDCTCNTTATFCNDIPMVGIDMLYHSNLLIISDTINHTGDTLSDGKLTSFTYYTNPQENWNGNDDAPYLIDHFYNYISGKWRNGEKYTKGSIAYNTQSTEYVNFVFTGEPCKPKEWSLANLTFSGFDIRSIQSIGPFDTYPGQVIDLTYSVVYAPNIQYPNPCLDEIRAVDDKIQQFFDRNFNFKNNFDKGPDAPTLKISPNILSINFTFINDLISNNFNLKYKSSLVNNEIVNQDSFFRFEGYRVYQILDTNLLFKDLYTLTNTNSVKEVFQADISNQIKDIFAYKPSYGTVLNPTTWNKSTYMLNANNQGIPDKFELTTDAFTGHRFENGKTYYFTAIAYAYNNYMDFNELIGKGQSKQFLEGSRNKKIYKVTIPKSLNNIQNPIVTRLEGVGNGGNYLQVLPTMKDSILKYNNYSHLKYPSFNSPELMTIFLILLLLMGRPGN
ncbi:MAG: hypothetical protein IPL95_11460 [Saprospiraceae bacterium]|nr:hypothetical protein [Saprospiraceae bacterium]